MILNKRQSSRIIDAVSFKTQVHDFGLATLAQDGEVFLWDVRNMLRCVHTVKSEGVVRASRLAVNPHNGKQLAVAGHTEYKGKIKNEQIFLFSKISFLPFLLGTFHSTNSTTHVYQTI